MKKNKVISVKKKDVNIIEYFHAIGELPDEKLTQRELEYRKMLPKLVKNFMKTL